MDADRLAVGAGAEAVRRISRTRLSSERDSDGPIPWRVGGGAYRLQSWVRRRSAPGIGTGVGTGSPGCPAARRMLQFPRWHP